MEKKVLYCVNCQRRLPQASAFCPQCGQSTDNAIEKHMMDPPTAEFTSPYPRKSNWQLALVRPDGQQVVFPLGDTLRIGRSSENDLALPDHQVSRFHALIEKGEAGFQISDKGSTNGSFVNRTRVHSPVKLRIGDVITIGQFRLLVQRDSLHCGHCAQLVKSSYMFCPHCGDALTGLSVPQKTPVDTELEGLPTDPLDEPVRLAPEKPKRPAQKKIEQLRQAAPKPRAQAPRRPSTSPKATSSPVAKTPAAPKPAAKPSSVKMEPEAPKESISNQRIIRGCAIAFVVAICLLAAIVLAGYWAYRSGLILQ